MADQSRSQWSVPRHEAVYDSVIPLTRLPHLMAPKVDTNLAHLRRLEKGGMSEKCVTFLCPVPHRHDGAGARGRVAVARPRRHQLPPLLK
jgi:hypothetical protein